MDVNMGTIGRRERIKSILGTVRWDDPETVVEKAEAWYRRNQGFLVKLEALLRRGESAATWKQYCDELTAALQQRHAEKRIRPAWESGDASGLAPDLLAELESASQPPTKDSRRGKAFDKAVSGFPKETQDQIDQRNRVRRAQRFLTVVVTRVAVEQAARKGELCPT
jgi:hypothetical protein